MTSVSSNLRGIGKIKPMPTMKGNVPIFATNLTLHQRRRRVRWHLGEVLGCWKAWFRIKPLFNKTRRAEGRVMIGRTGVVRRERRWNIGLQNVINRLFCLFNTTFLSKKQSFNICYHIRVKMGCDRGDE